VLDRYTHLDEHLARMEASAGALGLAFDQERVLQVLVGEGRLNPGRLVVRVDLGPDGRFNVSTREAPPACGPAALMVSPFRTDPGDPLLRHKTGVRGFYNREHRRATHQGFFDALFLNRLDRVTEGAITNLFARFGDEWVTPPVADGLLPGIWRAAFMAETGAAEHSLTLDELATADEIVVGNSVRGAVPVASIVADPVVF